MSLEAVFLDVGETLVNEERYWHEVAALAGLDSHVVLAALGMTIARGEDHTELWRHLGVPKPEELVDVVYELDDLYPDALPCLESLQALGLRIGLAGNQSHELERWTREADLPASIVGSSASWGVRKPAPEFFERMLVEAQCRSHELAYVGDRVDNDVVPALEAGFVAVHLRRGPWGRVQRTPSAAIGVESLAELADALASLR
ncbi:MAG: HAD family hydrolase [Actinobacteria bacterium]|nr:HAD family hydrolase [Actinomycetota bacterium]